MAKVQLVILKYADNEFCLATIEPDSVIVCHSPNNGFLDSIESVEEFHKNTTFGPMTEMDCNLYEGRIATLVKEL